MQLNAKLSILQIETKRDEEENCIYISFLIIFSPIFTLSLGDVQ